MDLDKLLTVITNHSKGIKSTQIRSEYKKMTGESVSIGDEREALIELKNQGKIKFISEPWRNSCWVVLPNHKESCDYPKDECELFW